MRFHRCDLVVETNFFRLRSRWLLPISGIEFCQIATDISFDLRHPALEFCIGKIAVAAVDGLELAAVDSDDGIRKQVQLLAQHDELPTDLADGFAVIFSEVRYRLEIGRQASGEPHQFDVAPSLALKPPARLNTIEVAINVELEQHGRMVRWPPSFSRLHAFEPKAGKIEFFDKYIDHTDWIILSHVIVQELRKQRALCAIFAFDKTLHVAPWL